jgi:glycosyltransferase involved in cell wall biosynthesis
VSTLSYDVVIPTHGRAPAMLDEAVRSVLDQRIPPETIVIVVDGSASAAAGVRARWPQCQVIALPHPAGEAAARNVGIAACRADWVCFLDDDDLWSHEKMSVTAQYLSDHPSCEAVRSSFYVFSSRGDAVEGYAGFNVDFRADGVEELEAAAAARSPRNDFEYLDIEGDSLGLLLERNRGVIGSSCVRRAILQTLPGVPAGTRPGADHVLFCLVATRTEWHLIDRGLLFYRVHPTQDSRRGDPSGGRGIIASLNAAWSLCGPAAPRPMGTYGPIYRRQFRRMLWGLLRVGAYREALRTYRATFTLLPRRRDRLAMLVPEPLAWHWRHRTTRNRARTHLRV